MSSTMSEHRQRLSPHRHDDSLIRRFKQSTPPINDEETYVTEADLFFKLSRLCNGSERCSPLVQLYCSPYRFDP